ncbi:DUF2304 domain-containing protein [Anaerosacchariphilus polymeriproducens]|uniref:DUF2304 domain-containing protein n=2 Tax=Anaerosacchariphilus polymeriproducens TaxID=1812858 RepID=A0A371ARV9_9FIRM|nr:DUF2304 domain-containing protein [Anaerosacchariphilus polymeriproducens]
MTILFRVVLIFVSFCTSFFILRKIRQAKMQIEDSIFWIIFAGAVLLISIFPKIADYCASVLGIYSTVNFIFLFMIFVLLIRNFYVTIKLSQLDGEIKELTQEIAVAQTMNKTSEQSVVGKEEIEGEEQ